MKTIKIKIPATTANFGSGFDVLGAALKLYNEIEVAYEFTNSRVHELKIEIIGEGKDTLPKNEKNVVLQAMKTVFRICKTVPPAYKLRLINHIPLSRGIGSSASARLGGIVAANELCRKKLSEDEIIQIVSKLEGHPDNVVPSYFGGLCICNFDGNNVKYTKVKMPFDLKAVLCIPDFELSTDKARNILPKTIPHKDAVFNSSRVALFMSAIIQKKYELLSIAMEDKLHQPYRKKLIPGMDDVFKSAEKSGAYGVCISGSGPSILAISNENSAVKIGMAMQKAFFGHRITSKYIICDFDNNGIQISK
ncbi:MAG TPA: homoserine kinase [Elusimicrobia bacterium]|nr:homoserine kinase [Elusimicrobiota bacterium]